MIDDDPLERLASSWDCNAAAWTEAVRSGRIESRRLATDNAIVQAALAHRPQRVLDIGCGEGWLCRTLTAAGIEAIGLDASAPLIDAACAAGGASYHRMSYDELRANGDRLGGFDVLICNFALLEASLDGLLAALHSRLRPRGVLLIQTVHPWSARGDAAYRDGWRTETFAGFGSGFSAPMPWYYRTLESWLSTLDATGWQVTSLAEPAHPQTGLPASLLIGAATKSRP
ncbi:MAG TPA: methyltransferase domain-containing protein [Fontimonas sp.]